MRFKQQFEFHKVPEWDEYYFPYDSFLHKLENIIKKMYNYRMDKLSSRKFDLSESFNMIEDAKLYETMPILQPEIDIKKASSFKLKKGPISLDDSLGIELAALLPTNNDDLEEPLLALSTDVKETIEEFIHQCKHLDEFYIREKNRITNGFRKFYTRFEHKISDQSNALNLEDDLKEHGLDGLGYASSWARQFMEFYSKLSWLDGFAKINVIAMQKILKKFDKLLFDQEESQVVMKLGDFIKNLC